jgi:hypothetical protein
MELVMHFGHSNEGNLTKSVHKDKKKFKVTHF